MEPPCMLSEQPVLGTRGMVACAHYLATQAGISILTQGGNAIDAALAEEGVAVTTKLSGWLKRAAEPILKQWESSSAVFLPDGQPFKTGQILRQPDLASTYRMLAAHGRDAFYRGPLARSITEYVQQSGGVLSME